MLEKRGRFKEESLSEVVAKLHEFDKYISKLKQPLLFAPSAEEIEFHNGSIEEALDY